ncbi:MAG: hypothetical protein C0508_08475 [Cyanobacteria bacterium PR.023]|jgi:hypothetical protein|nr:hypothetical protein [Cyanobacteria bacterium PR.023]
MAQPQELEAAHREIAGKPAAAHDATLKLYDESQKLLMESSLVGKVTTSISEAPDKSQTLSLQWFDREQRYNQAFIEPGKTYEITAPMAGCKGDPRYLAIYDSQGKQILDAKSIGNITTVDKSPITNSDLSNGQLRYTDNFRSLWWCDDNGKFTQRSLAPNHAFIASDKPFSK